MRGYDIQGNGLRIGHMRGGIGSFSRLQTAGAFSGLVAGMLAIALGNITGWTIIGWALAPTVLGGVVGTQVWGVSFIGHAWYALLFACTRWGWSLPTAGSTTEETTVPPIACALLDGERVVWQVVVPQHRWEQR